MMWPRYYDRRGVSYLILATMSFFFGLGRLQAVALDSTLDDKIQQVCVTKFDQTQCKKACATAKVYESPKVYYWNVSHATQKACDYVLRSHEAEKFPGIEACSASKCLYKLEQVSDNPKTYTTVFMGSGYKVVWKPAPVPQYAGGSLYLLSDRSGKVTRFVTCGSCDISNLEYESGPLKKAWLYSGHGNELILQITK
jgi:hypothetical protein